MWRAINILIVLSVVSTTLGGCADSAMQRNQIVIQGHVLEQSDHTVLIDVGSADHVAIGDTFVVYRVIRFGDPAKGNTYSSERRSGSIQVDEILSAHRARATLEDGSASMGELVEFRHEP